MTETQFLFQAFPHTFLLWLSFSASCCISYKFLRLPSLTRIR